MEVHKTSASEQDIPDSQEKSPEELHLKSLVLTSIHHLNNRDLPSSPIWPLIATDFTSSGMGYEAPSKQAFIDDYHDYAFRFPDHCLTITDMTTSIKFRSTQGQVFANVDITGGHGVERGRLTRKAMIVFEFRKREGAKWVLVGTTSLPGFGGGDGLDGMV